MKKDSILGLLTPKISVFFLKLSKESGCLYIVSTFKK